MTLDEWVEDFKTIIDKFHWAVYEGIAIPYNGGCAPRKIRGISKDKSGFCGCPLTCYAYEKTGVMFADCSYRLSGKLFDIDQGVCDFIASNADGIEFYSLRSELIELLGLAEEKQEGGEGAESDVLPGTVGD